MKQEETRAEKWLEIVFECIGPGPAQSLIREAITDQCCRERERCIKWARECVPTLGYDAELIGACQWIEEKIRSGE
jgi:hypothetical protein